MQTKIASKKASDNAREPGSGTDTAELMTPASRRTVPDPSRNDSSKASSTGGFESGSASGAVKVIKPRKVPGSNVVCPIYCNVKSEASGPYACSMTKSAASNPVRSIEAGLNLSKPKIVMPQQSFSAVPAKPEAAEIRSSAPRGRADAEMPAGLGTVQTQVQTHVPAGLKVQKPDQAADAPVRPPDSTSKARPIVAERQTRVRDRALFPRQSFCKTIMPLLPYASVYFSSKAGALPLESELRPFGPASVRATCILDDFGQVR